MTWHSIDTHRPAERSGWRSLDLVSVRAPVSQAASGNVNFKVGVEPLVARPKPCLPRPPGPVRRIVFTVTWPHYLVEGLASASPLPRFEALGRLRRPWTLGELTSPLRGGSQRGVHPPASVRGVLSHRRSLSGECNFWKIRPVLRSTMTKIPPKSFALVSFAFPSTRAFQDP